MRLSHLAAYLCAAAFVVGCGGIPTKPDEKAGYYAEQAKKSFSENGNTYGAYYIGLALDLPTGVDKVKKLFADSPATKDAYLNNIRNNIADISTPQQAVSTQKDIDQAVSARVLSDLEEKELLLQFAKRIKSGNSQGTINFLIGPEVSRLPVLASDDQMKTIFLRTLAAYKTGEASRDMRSLVEYAMRGGADGQDAKIFERALPEMKVRGPELDVISPYFAGFATARRAEITAKVHLTVRNADRLFADDIQTHLSKELRGIEWVYVPGENVLELTVERVRNDERTTPETTQTITYSYSDVNILSAALLMPKNASYLFELSKGGASIDYGYVIAAQRGHDSKVETVARGTVEYSYKKCQNARIQNVFGGVSRAEFTANDHMQQECSGRAQGSLDDLRNQVMNRIVAQVLSIPAIKGVHEANL
jgi:uncharacterized protein YceK